MAILVCWASGLLEVKKNSEEELGGGPVVIARGTAGRLRGLMITHGELNNHEQFVVPGVAAFPKDDQYSRMTLVIAFQKKVNQSTQTRKEKLNAKS